MKKIIRNNLKTIIAFIIGIVIAGTTAYAANILFYSTDVGYDNSNGMTATTVQGAIDELYLLAKNAKKGCTTSPFKLGDYVEMTPTAATYPVDTSITGYNSTQANIKPSELNLWRVININDDCTVEVVSEYVSTTRVYFRGKTGYVNYVGYLLELAKQYANTAYTLNPNDSETPDGAFRIVGYNGQTKTITDTTKIDDSYLGYRTDGQGWNLDTNIPDFATNELLGFGDNYFGKDINLLNKAGINMIAYTNGTTNRAGYWLASRLYHWHYTSYWDFYARFVASDGYLNDVYVVSWYSGRFSETHDCYALRPIVTLKSGLTPTGSGTASSHYILN